MLFFEVKGGVEKVISSYGKTEVDKAKILAWQDVTNGMHQYYSKWKHDTPGQITLMLASKLSPLHD